MEVISNAIILGFFFIAFSLAITQFGEIGGWTVGEVAFLWGMAEFSFGMMDMIFRYYVAKQTVRWQGQEM